MLRQSEHGSKAVTTTTAFDDPTPIKRKTKTGKAKARLNSFDSDAYEEDDPQDESYELGISQIFMYSIVLPER